MPRGHGHDDEDLDSCESQLFTAIDSLGDRLSELKEEIGYMMQASAQQ
jgi:hypothetical protein